MATEKVSWPSINKSMFRVFIASAIVFLSLSLRSQDTLILASPRSFPADLDSVVLDSFYRARSIDYRSSPNIGLYFEVFRWYRTCYRYGGSSSRGIDCSHFVHMLYQRIYDKKLESSSSSIYTQCKPLKGGITKAVEGDLLFFKIRKKKISHVGLYLQNGKFAHASTQAGVIISDMDEPYYKKHFFKAGRLE